MLFYGLIYVEFTVHARMQYKYVKTLFSFFEGDAIDYLLKNIFTETAGSRKGFPKIAMIITDGKSQDPVEEYAKRLRNIGVEIFVLGMFFYSVFG